MGKNYKTSGKPYDGMRGMDFSNPSHVSSVNPTQELEITYVINANVMDLTT